jgi:AcrR family transcriptional regulator
VTQSYRSRPQVVRESILDAVERMLATRRLDDITVVDLIEEAGVSRASFYVYFESKHAAVAARAEQAMDAIYGIWAPWLACESDTSGLEEVWLRSIALWREQQAVLMAAAQAWRADNAVGSAWEELMQRYAGAVRERIVALRECGMAAPDPDAAILATALVWLNESAMYMTFQHGDPPPVGDELLAEVLSSVWRRVVGVPSPESPAPPAIQRPAPVTAAPERLAQRRRRRAPDAEARQAFLAATEELLRERHLDELTVVDVIERAGFSRATFYAYFESKHAVVAALARQVFDEMYERFWQSWLELSSTGEPDEWIAQYKGTLAIWREHPVLTAAAVGWRTDPQAYAAWGELWRENVEITVGYIERARAAGAAEPWPEVRTLAAILVWLSETLLYLAFAGSTPLGDDQHLAEAVAAIWLRSIHGHG